MGLSIKRNTALGVMTEVTEGTYLAPSGVSKFVQTLAQGFDIKPAKELLKRNIFTSSIGETSPLTGMFHVAGTIPVEARAGSAEGVIPQYDVLMKSAMGASHTISSTTTTKTANSGTVLQIQDADISKFAIGDIVMIKESGAYVVSPITAVDPTGGAANITLLVGRASGNFPDNVVISKSAMYTVADSGHPSMSISKYIENAILEQATGCKVNSLTLDTFTTGKIPTFAFGIEGLNFDSSVTAIPFTPSYDTVLPPIVLDGRAYSNGSSIEINELKFAIQNNLAFETSIAASNGRVASRVSDRTIKGNFNPYKPNNSVTDFTNFKNNSQFSLFGYAKVPTGVTGQFGNVVAFYMPNCIGTEIHEADANGLLQNMITFQASRGTAGTTPEIYIGFI